MAPRIIVEGKPPLVWFSSFSFASVLIDLLKTVPKYIKFLKDEKMKAAR